MSHSISTKREHKEDMFLSLISHLLTTHPRLLVHTIDMASFFGLDFCTPYSLMIVLQFALPKATLKMHFGFFSQNQKCFALFSGVVPFSSNVLSCPTTTALLCSSALASILLLIPLSPNTLPLPYSYPSGNWCISLANDYSILTPSLSVFLIP